MNFCCFLRIHKTCDYEAKNGIWHRKILLLEEESKSMAPKENKEGFDGQRRRLSAPETCLADLDNDMKKIQYHTSISWCRAQSLLETFQTVVSIGVSPSIAFSERIAKIKTMGRLDCIRIIIWYATYVAVWQQCRRSVIHQYRVW